MALHANQQLIIHAKGPGRSESTSERKLNDKLYSELGTKVRELDCCSLQSTTSKHAPSPTETLGQLEINLEGMHCKVVLWDSEWRVGRARDCGLAVAKIHRRGFVAEAAVDDAEPTDDSTP